jgi:hypothetical protein
MFRSLSKARLRLAGVAGVLALSIAACDSGTSKINMTSYAETLATALAKACPMAGPDNAAAFDACRKQLGAGAEAKVLHDTVVLWGGEQSTLSWDKKKLSYFKGEIFERLYLSLYMFTGKQRIVGEGPEGTTVVAVEAYFRNGLPPGGYPYPFWHSGAKWEAYEKSNEIRFYLTAEGKARFVTRGDSGSNDNRGAYAAVKPPAFAGEWTWTDASGQAQPYITLFGDLFSANNPHLARVDETYKAVALSMRNADCSGCHAPDGHKYMNRLTLLQTPQHAAGEIEGVLKTVRDNKMPQTEKGDPKVLDPKIKSELLINGDAFKKALDAASDWQKKNGQSQPTS